MVTTDHTHQGQGLRRGCSMPHQQLGGQWCLAPSPELQGPEAGREGEREEGRREKGGRRENRGRREGERRVGGREGKERGRDNGS